MLDLAAMEWYKLHQSMYWRPILEFDNPSMLMSHRIQLGRKYLYRLPIWSDMVSYNKIMFMPNKLLLKRARMFTYPNMLFESNLQYYYDGMLMLLGIVLEWNSLHCLPKRAIMECYNKYMCLWKWVLFQWCSMYHLCWRNDI